MGYWVYGYNYFCKEFWNEREQYTEGRGKEEERETQIPGINGNGNGIGYGTKWRCGYEGMSGLRGVDTLLSLLKFN